jgi:cell wall-associated NlpC family hydrolase
VATPKLSIRFLRPLTVLVLAVGSLGAFPATSHAAPHPAPPPRTSADARQQLAQLGEQAEIVAEQYNDARVTLVRRKAEYRIATRQAHKIQQQYVALGGQVKRVVSAAYMNVPFGQFTMMLTSRSPSDFVDQLSTLRLLATKRGALLTKVARVKAAALRAQARAQTALSVKKADLARRKVVLEALLRKLTTEEQTRLAGDAAERASRSGTRQPPPTGSVTIGPTSAAAKLAVQVALAQQGKPYSWGAAGPDAFDCSGLVMYAWAQAGVSLPHSSSMQYSSGTKVSVSSMQPGDLVFYGSPIHHVAMYVGGGQVIHAPQTGDVVRYASVDMMPIVGAVRP